MMPRAAFTLLTLLWLAAPVFAFDTVILDPGHGGHDRGAAIGYVYEKHLALDTARRVQQLLSSAGLRVVMTRDTDVFIPLEGRSRVGNSRSGAIFVSIHYNYNRGGSGHGIETYHCHGASYPLAAYIQAYVIKESGLENRGVKQANFHVIRATTKNPAVLVECGFVSNRAERGAMVTGNYREHVAEGIAKGIIAYHRK
jgi:N-acetylmuramoyl-L-alanine amidase